MKAAHGATGDVPLPPALPKNEQRISGSYGGAGLINFALYQGVCGEPLLFYVMRLSYMAMCYPASVMHIYASGNTIKSILWGNARQADDTSVQPCYFTPTVVFKFLQQNPAALALMNAADEHAQQWWASESKYGPSAAMTAALGQQLVWTRLYAQSFQNFLSETANPGGTYMVIRHGTLDAGHSTLCQMLLAAPPHETVYSPQGPLGYFDRMWVKFSRQTINIADPLQQCAVLYRLVAEMISELAPAAMANRGSPRLFEDDGRTMMHSLTPFHLGNPAIDMTGCARFNQLWTQPLASVLCSRSQMFGSDRDHTAIMPISPAALRTSSSPSWTSAYEKESKMTVFNSTDGCPNLCVKHIMRALYYIRRTQLSGLLRASQTSFCYESFLDIGVGAEFGRWLDQQPDDLRSRYQLMPPDNWDLKNLGSKHALARRQRYNIATSTAPPNRFLPPSAKNQSSPAMQPPQKISINAAIPVMSASSAAVSRPGPGAAFLNQNQNQPQPVQPQIQNPNQNQSARIQKHQLRDQLCAAAHAPGPKPPHIQIKGIKILQTWLRRGTPFALMAHDARFLGILRTCLDELKVPSKNCDDLFKNLECTFTSPASLQKLGFASPKVGVEAPYLIDAATIARGLELAPRLQADLDQMLPEIAFRYGLVSDAKTRQKPGRIRRALCGLVHKPRDIGVLVDIFNCVNALPTSELAEHLWPSIALALFQTCQAWLDKWPVMDHDVSWMPHILNPAVLQDLLALDAAATMVPQNPNQSRAAMLTSAEHAASALSSSSSSSNQSLCGSPAPTRRLFSEAVPFDANAKLAAPRPNNNSNAPFARYLDADDFPLDGPMTFPMIF